MAIGTQDKFNMSAVLGSLAAAIAIKGLNSGISEAGLKMESGVQTALDTVVSTETSDIVSGTHMTLQQLALSEIGAELQNGLSSEGKSKNQKPDNTLGKATKPEQPNQGLQDHTQRSFVQKAKLSASRPVPKTKISDNEWVKYWYDNHEPVSGSSLKSHLETQKSTRAARWSSNETTFASKPKAYKKSFVPKESQQSFRNNNSPNIFERAGDEFIQGVTDFDNTMLKGTFSCFRDAPNVADATTNLDPITAFAKAENEIRNGYNPITGQRTGYITGGVNMALASLPIAPEALGVMRGTLDYAQYGYYSLKSSVSGFFERDAGAEKSTIQYLDHSSVNFSQSSVNDVDSLIQKMSLTGWGEIPPIDVVKMPDGSLVTLDNTRLLAASRVDIPVKAIIHEAEEPLDKELAERFTTKAGGVPTNWVEAAFNRIGKQNYLYRATYPYGSQITGSR